MIKTKYLYIALIILTAIVISISFAPRFNKPVSENISMIKVTKGSVEDVITATGQIDTAMLIDVGAQVSGQIKSLAISEGDYVLSGQTIADIDALTQRNELKNSQAALTVLNAEKMSKESALRQALALLKRQKILYRNDASTQQEVEDAKEAVITARAEIMALQARTVQAQLEVDKRKLNLGYTHITAPVTGTVIALNTRVGQTVNASQTSPTIAKIADLEKMNIRIRISEADILKIKAGMQAEFTLYASEKRHLALVRSINFAPEAILKESSNSTLGSNDGAIYYNALLEVIQPAPELRIGMTALVTLIKDRAENTLLIPTNAINYSADRRAFVKVINNHKAPRQQLIRTGITGKYMTEVIDGLAEGDDVLLTSNNPKDAP